MPFPASPFGGGAAAAAEGVFRGRALSCDADPYPLLRRDFPRRGKQNGRPMAAPTCAFFVLIFRIFVQGIHRPLYVLEIEYRQIAGI